MSVSIEVEDPAWKSLSGLEELVQATVKAVLSEAAGQDPDCDIAVLFTDDDTIAALNGEWRGKPKPTNVLSFPTPHDMPVPAGEPRPLGDVVLAHGVVMREAAEQGKTLRDHTAHLIVHGTLHLIGYDHEDDDEADKMEALEIRVLKGLGISDPCERD